MLVNFIEFEDAEKLRQVLETHLPVGSATISDVLLFVEENKLQHSSLLRDTNNFVGHPPTKHETYLSAITSAPKGFKTFFRLSNWKNILKYSIQLWRILLEFGNHWSMHFYFDNDILSEVDVWRSITSL